MTSIAPIPIFEFTDDEGDTLTLSKRPVGSFMLHISSPGDPDREVLALTTANELDSIDEWLAIWSATPDRPTAGLCVGDLDSSQHEILLLTHPSAPGQVMVSICCSFAQEPGSGSQNVTNSVLLDETAVTRLRTELRPSQATG